ncbi:MAG: molecular chaperone SurA [Gammaproteobacteria bacterium]|nr:peptidylprolyl isomerase [Gammaproteobacteria bacterium]NNC96885.1 molecular chaperone SurA [Gammaproteobacteria bacterium]NNM14003.1 molecular chaperone SurA [Gammaproteobacteria bacterium]
MCITAQAELLDRIVAVVNDDIILQSEYETELRVVIARLQATQQQLPSRAQVAKQVLEQLIVKKIQTQRARNAGLRIPDEMINQALATIAQRNGTSLSQLPAALAADGVDYATFREEIRQEITIQQLTQRELSGNIRVSDAEVERLISQGNADQEYLIKHILLTLDEDAPEELREKKFNLINTLKQRIADGENFSKLAIAYSNGAKSLEGGNLGWRNLAQVPSIFSDMIRSLEVNQVSDVIRSPSGFHLIMIEDTRGNELPEQIIEQYKVRHILISDSDLGTDEENKEKLLKLKQDIESGTDFSELARLHSQDPGSATKGGELGWSVTDVYDPSFAGVIKTTPIGEVSEPFRSQFGWHILEVQDKREKDMAEDLLRNRARNALREQKFEEESLLWMQRLRDEAYVEYRL